jgi:hypothetical protein
MNFILQLLIGLIVVIAVGYFLSFLDNNNQIQQIQQIIEPSIDTKLYEYVKTIHRDMYNVKIPKFSDSSTRNLQMFYKTYIKCVRKPNNDEIETLNKISNHADKFIEKASMKCLKDVKWKFYISEPELEYNMPFTISNKIIIPETKCLTINTETLIHEKIHVLQRKHQDKFNNLYKQIYTFLLSKCSPHIIPDSLQKINMNNPDGNNTYWIYRVYNKLWFPLLVIDDTKLKEYAYCVKYNNNNNEYEIDINEYMETRKLLKEMPPNVSLYHPNEIFACQIAESIYNKRPIDPTILEFINNL